MADHRDELGVGGLIASMFLLVAVGAPMVYYLWTVVNEIMAGVWDWSQIVIGVPVLVVFLAYLVFVVRRIYRWEGTGAQTRT